MDTTDCSWPVSDSRRSEVPPMSLIDPNRSFVCICYARGWRVRPPTLPIMLAAFAAMRGCNGFNEARVSRSQKRPCTPKLICLPSAATIAIVRRGLSGSNKR
jgi:hypothetical protein